MWVFGVGGKGMGKGEGGRIEVVFVWGDEGHEDGGEEIGRTGKEGKRIDGTLTFARRYIRKRLDIHAHNKTHPNDPSTQTVPYTQNCDKNPYPQSRNY